jgi:hypothetical protein
MNPDPDDNEMLLAAIARVLRHPKLGAHDRMHTLNLQGGVRAWVLANPGAPFVEPTTNQPASVLTQLYHVKLRTLGS